MYNQGYVPQNQGQQSGSWYAPSPQPRQQQARRSGGSSGKQPPQKPKKKRSLKWQLIKVLIVIVLIAGACAGGYIWKTQNEVKPYMSVFLPNIYVDGISLSGLTWQEGSQKVWEQANAKENSWYVRLKNTSGQYQDITADMLGISFDPSAALEEAWAIGHATDASGRKDIFELQQEIAAAKNTTYSFTSAQQSADTTPIDNILTTLQTVAYKAPQDAALLSFNPDDLNNPFTFQQESYGQWLDVTAVKEQILEMVSTLQSGEILLETTPIAPSVTVAELKKNVELRFRATTAISSKSTEDRTNNIRVAFERINGTILQNGKTFSFNSAVGRREAGNGYYPAIEYAYGTETWGIGGGSCQAAGGKFVHITAAFYTAPVGGAHQFFCGEIDHKLAAFLDQMMAVALRPNADAHHAGLCANGAAPSHGDQIRLFQAAAAHQNSGLGVQQSASAPNLLAHRSFSSQVRSLMIYRGRALVSR